MPSITDSSWQNTTLLEKKMRSIKGIYHTKNEIFWLILFIGLTIFYIVLATLANADLTAGRFAINMDERIIYDGVENILHPIQVKRFVWYVSSVDNKGHGDYLETVDSRLKNFFWSVFDGGDHRYGRSLWNVIAMFSFLPEIFFGESGQIFTERMIEVVFLLSAFILLTVTFLRHWALRFLLLVALLTMPYTEYFMSQPKPEPLQILFIAVFLNFFQKNEMRLQGYYWIFLGLAFGTKISTLPVIVVVLFAASLKYFPNIDFKKMVSEFIGALGFFLLGLAISVPILLPNIAVSIIIYRAMDRYMLVTQNWLLKLGLVTSLVIINPVIAFVLYSKFKLITGLTIWGGSTFLNTKHGRDASNVGFSDWIDHFLYDWMIAPIAITTLLIALSSVQTLRFVIQKAESRLFSCWLNSTAPIFVMLSGFALNLAICLFTHRLWGYYLLPGTVLILVGLFSIFEHYLFSDNSWKRTPKNQDGKLDYYLSLSGLILVSTITFFWWMPQSLFKLKDLANRTTNLEYEKEYRSYIELTEFISKYAKQKNKRLIIAFDPNLFIPKSNKSYQITEYMGPYTNWEANPDLIIMSQLFMQKNKFSIINKDTGIYNEIIKQRDGYNKYVVDKDTECLQEKCYQRYLELTNGGEILVLMP